MTSNIISQTTDAGAAVLAEYGTDIIDVEKLSVSTGWGGRNKHPLASGDHFVLITEKRNDDPISVRSDRSITAHHLADKAPGYQWGSDPTDSFQITFTYLGTYEYVEATLNQATLDVTLRFRRVSAEATR